MNLSEQGNVVTEMSPGENVGEVKEELSVIDLGIGNLSVSPLHYDSSLLGTDGSSVSMVKSEASGDGLLLSFDSISVIEDLEARDDVITDSITADILDSNGQTDQYAQRLDEGKDTSKFYSSDSAIVAKPAVQRGGEGWAFARIDKTCRPNLPLSVYTLNQNIDSMKPPKCRKMASKNSVVDLSFSKILRKSRSSFSKQPRSSVWGSLWNVIPDFEENSKLAQNLGNERKLRRVKGGKGKRNSLRDQMDQESVGNSYTPTGHISLKIKIGNKICIIGNATEKFCTSGKGALEITGTMENELGEELPRGMRSPHERNSKEVISSDASALSKHLGLKVVSDNSSFNTSSVFHHIISPEDGNNLGASVENLCSDVGTSPDSEVINSVPDDLLCEKSLSNMRHSSVISKACASPSNISSLISSPKKSKKGNKKGKLYQVGNCTLEINLTDAKSPNDARIPLYVGDVSSSGISQAKSKKGKKKNKTHKIADCSVKSNQTAAETTNGAKVPAYLEADLKMGDSMMTTSKPCMKYTETDPCSGLVAAIESTKTQVFDTLVSFCNGRKSPKCARANRRSKRRSRIFDSSQKLGRASKKMENNNNVGGKSHVNEKVGASGVLCRVESLHAAGYQTPSDLGEVGALSKDLTGPIKSLQASSGRQREQCTPPRNAWVRCDECKKWRRIPAILLDHIEETKCGWTCKENMDVDFADCSIPQVKSNSEVNGELGLFEASCEEDGSSSFWELNDNRPKVAQPSSWSLIKSNLFLHRGRKTQTIDEVMICHCKPSSNGRIGCGAKCLNRMLNIECVQGTCPCGELCSNQQFQKCKYAKLKWFRCGKKGYGLQALEDISRGQFLIEYVGEVLGVHDYEARQRECALNGYKHFYFMMLNGSEVIDARAKGNLGRFINHSCDPNCCTEKWMVNGEVCIGLFALRDIKKGEEVTFDYNYVRVFGAAAKKCVCGSPNCRGYIGGDPTNSEVIVQDDSDDEYSEPVMTCGDREMIEDWRHIMSSSLDDEENEIANEAPERRCSRKKLISVVSESIMESCTSKSSTQKVKGINSAQVAKAVVQDRFEVDNSIGNDWVEQLDIKKISSESLNGSVTANLKVKSEGFQSHMHTSSQLMDISLQTDSNLNKEISSAHIFATPRKPFSDIDESKRKLKYASVEERDELAKSNSLAKTILSSLSAKKGKQKTNIMNDKGTPDMDKLNAAVQKPKKLTELSISSHFEAVEEKLNELLDPEGGISKRKDASRGYLKILFLTAASGNNGHGEAAIQSSRDLSMILDALLKTKSRSVLTDIIKKNGLQMLHNIMKQYRKEFIKTPILRKLLKVLEHLALREILTSEHITGGPPCPGLESFKDSILILTEHADKQVHQIARNFRDRWIPRYLRRNCCMEMDDGRSEFHQRSSHDGLSTSNDQRSERGGKPSEAINSCEKHLVAPSSTVGPSTPDPSSASAASSGTKTRKRKSQWDNPVEECPHSRTSANLAGDGRLSVNENIPPGFSSLFNGHVIPSDAAASINNQEIKKHVKQHLCDVILGDLQQRFIARMPISYGVPKSLMQKFWGPQNEGSDCWTIAPGVPFHPFPPLPPHATGLPKSAARCALISEVTEKEERHSENCTAYQSGQKHTRTCSMDPPDNGLSAANGQPDFQLGTSYSLGRKFFRQQKCNPVKLAPPWVRMRNGWGYAGNNTKNASPGVGLGNGANGFRNLYDSQEVNWREL